jgi:hypothetical protein
VSKYPIVFSNFEGGWSGDIKQGAPGTFWFSRGIDFRKSPSELTVLPGLAKESGSVVTGLVTDMIQLPSGLMVAIDSSGGVYKRTTGGVWSKDATTLTNTAYGMVYNQQQDRIYIPGTSRVHSISNADGRFGGTFTVNEGTFTNQQDQASTAGHAQSYTTTGAVSEAAVDLKSFTPTIEPLYSVKVWVTTKGTGSLTVTVHDAANNTLGTATLTNGSITNGAYNEFVFSAPLRMLAKPNPATYHFHATHPTGTAHIIGTSTASDLSTADYNTQSNRLVSPNNGFHPVIEFLQYVCILNERYLAVWEPISMSAPSATEFNQHRLTFPQGYEGTSAALYSQYIAVACERRSTSATNEFQDGKIFLWDGISTTYNLIINVPEGAPYALHAHKNRLYWWANGGWWAWAGGNPVRVFQMRDTDPEFTGSTPYLVNYPNTMTVRNNILLGAFPSETNSTTIEHGVFSFGQRDKNYPESIGESYNMSTGSLLNGTLRQGMIKNFGDKLFLSWRDGSSYGVDKIDATSNPASTSTWESLITDVQVVSSKRRSSRPDNDKQSTYFVISFNRALPTGCTVTPKYKINRESSWQAGTPAVAGDTEVILNINKRYKESQVGFDIVCTTSTPHISAGVYVTDTLGQEGD